MAITGWKDARAELKTILEGVSITSPITETIARVYEFPPAQVQDQPCIIIYPPALDVQRNIGSLRIKNYRVICRLLLRDEDLGRASELADAYREALADKIDDNVTLNGKATVVSSQEITAVGNFSEAGYPFFGLDCILGIEFKETATFNA